MSNSTAPHTEIQTVSNGQPLSELALLRRENEELRRKLGLKAGYIRNKTNELLDVMGTKPLQPDELDDETLVELDPLGIITASIKHVLENLRETNALLQKSNDETAAIFAAADVGILVIDSSKRIKSYNNKLKELFFPESDSYSITGKLCNDEVCKNTQTEEGCACDLVLGSKKSVSLRNWKANGRAFDVAATPFSNQFGEISDLVVVYNDITELKTAEEQLSRMNVGLEKSVSERTRQLESANKELETFCYTVSHDLRAPLRHINGFASILSDECTDSLNDLGRDCLKRILSSSRRMEILIDDLLHLSRVSQAEIHRVNVDLSDSATKVIAMFRDTEPERVVKTVVADGLRAFGDSMLLDLVLQNLIGNAWKYSSKNPDAVIEFGRCSVNGKNAFFIRDNGVGFNMGYSSKLFHVFERLHGSEFEGTGIGLATVKKIITRHGGEIWAESEIGRGSVFYFTLPDQTL